MPLIDVEMYEGRTLEQKKKLVEGLTEAFTKIGTPADAVQVVLNEHPRTNWARGGKLASER